ncbi:MAG TPA: hypothetical protein VK324_15115, partial [Tepidisphaeraceae bacterium]|nr:hypothetical protein [Tepidisphaeraceae bacterium]
MTDRRPPAASPKGRMVRTILLAGGTLALLGGLFAIYWQFLPSHRPATTEAGGVPVVAPRPLATTAPGGGTLGKIGAGTAPWVSQFDDDNALISQFRSEEFLPQPDQTVKLVGPEFKVRLGNGQMMHLVAAGGDVYVAPPAPTKKNPLGMGSQQMPSHGKLYDVTVRIFPTWATDADAARPTATIERLQNVAFDNDASRVYTDAYTAPDGTTIPGDRVPVHVRGDAFDLDGHGLTLRWDDQGGQLQLLEIAHGGRLVVRDAKALGDVTGQPTTSQARRPNAEVGDPAFAVLNVSSGYQHASPSPRTRGEGGGEGRSPGIAPRRPPLSLTLSPSSGRGNWTHATPLGLALATGTGGSGAPALASTDPAAAAVLPPTTQKAAVPYRATLADDVKVEQAGVTLGTGDRLTVDFLGEAMKTTADEPPRKPASKKPQGTKKPK